MHRIPFIRIAIPFAIGIVAKEFLNLSNSVIIILAAVSFFIALISLVPYFKSLAIKYNQLIGLSVMICFFSVSYLYTNFRLEPKPLWIEGEQTVMQVQISDTPQRREKSYRVEARMMNYISDEKIYVEGGKMLLYFSKDLPCEQWLPGDKLTFASTLNTIDGPKNPGEFDLATYNRRKGIYHRAFINSKQLINHTSESGFSFSKLLHSAEKYLLNSSAKYFNSPAEKALADALVLGYQDDLDEETVTRFSRSGTSHVLAVSGLHIGILWLIIDKLLFFLNRYKSTRWLKFFLSLSILWAYALLTGLSPSVMRAAVMFSCLAAGGIMQQKYSSLNILFVSAFIQMLINPMVLFNAGFQLSYSAVAGILIFYPLIKNAIYIRQKYVRLLWELVALTLAAQLITTPISLYWFGQFPVWFLFSNLPLVPLSGIALQLGLAAFSLEWIPYLGALLFNLFALSIKLMDTIAAFFSDLPFALLYIRLDLFEAFLLYVLMTTITLFIVKKNPIWFKSSIAVICVFLSSMLFNEINFSKTDKWVAYSLKKGTVVRHFKNHDVEEYCSESVDKKGYSYSVKPSDKAFQVRNQHDIISNDGFFCIGGKNVVMLQKKHLTTSLEKPVHCDWIILESMKYVDFDMLTQNFNCRKIIIGSGNSYKSKKYWKKECTKRKIPFYDLSASGALISS